MRKIKPSTGLSPDHADTRKDLQEALAFAGDGLVHTTFTQDSLDHINNVLGRMKRGEIEGRVVMRIGDEVVA